MIPAVDADVDPARLLDLAVRAARGAGALLLERFGGPASGVDHKSSATDPVSDADRDAERLIAAAIARERPADALLAEEGGARPGGGLRWIVDPLDGTVNYLFGIPVWAVSIACEDEHGGLVAVVLDPCRDELFSARRGDGARLDGRPLAPPRDVPLERALVATGFGYRAEQRAAQAEVVARVLPRVRDIRRAGSAALDLAWLAAGRVDAYYEHGLNRWDRAAGELLVREAGGVVEELAGGAGLPPGLAAGHARVVAALRSLVP
jgi:myo-inositol-1(or 4)-monophosphatase